MQEKDFQQKLCPSSDVSKFQMTDTELAAWLQLAYTPGIGGQKALQLLQKWGLPDRILQQTQSELVSVIGQKLAHTLLHPDRSTITAIEKAIAWRNSDLSHEIITLSDSRYPAILLQAPSPPIVFFAKGCLKHLDRPALAVVGSRHATLQGKSHAKGFAAAMVQAGFTVVSGLAAGIDAHAHEGALLHGGQTIGVLGTGIDVIYPRQNSRLAHEMFERGLVISEFALGTQPNALNFPRRNRLIAGLSKGVLVVEAALHSGSLITARLAAEMGREVFAIPGSIHAPLAKGCHWLIKQGAQLVDSMEDINDALWQQNIKDKLPIKSKSKQSQTCVNPELQATQTNSRLSLETHVTAGPEHGSKQRFSGKKHNSERDQRKKGDESDSTIKLPEGLTELETAIMNILGFEVRTIDDISCQITQPIANIQATLLSLELDGWVMRTAGGSYQRIL